MIAISVHELKKQYGRQEALRGLSFEVPQGAIVGFLGPNGAGKSTTLRILAGLLVASSGEAFVCGYSVARQAQLVRRCVGYMPEHNPLPEGLRVGEFLLYRGRLKGVQDPRGAVAAVLEACQIDSRVAKQRIGTLSKGYRQRVGIADALIGSPKLLILDEPTAGLDPVQVYALRELLVGLSSRMTILLSTHVLSEVERFCNYVLILNAGTLVAQGPYPELLGQHASLEDLFLAKYGVGV